MTFKRLFSRSLAAAPNRLHFAAHSHHLWPDASFEGQQQAWLDAARLADRKWDKVMGEVWPEAQAHVARELGTGMAESVVFACNTHDLLVRLWAAAPRRFGRTLRVLASSGEFHSARRQFARWSEASDIILDEVAVEPFETFSDRFVAAAAAGNHDLVLVSHVLFGSGRLFDRVAELSALGRAEGPWIVIDGYHAFMAIEQPFHEAVAHSAFYLGGGYKYAMAGEGCAFMHAPPDFGPRPPITGWFAEFEDLSLPPGSVGYASDASRFMGATFDPSALYRFNAIQRTLLDEGLTTARINEHVAERQSEFLAGLPGTALATAELLNPPGGDRRARFLAFRHLDADRRYRELLDRDCVTDVRGNVLRVGFGLYQDSSDVQRLLNLLRSL